MHADEVRTVCRGCPNKSARFKVRAIVVLLVWRPSNFNICHLSFLRLVVMERYTKKQRVIIAKKFIAKFITKLNLALLLGHPMKQRQIRAPRWSTPFPVRIHGTESSSDELCVTCLFGKASSCMYKPTNDVTAFIVTLRRSTDLGPCAPGTLEQCFSSAGPRPGTGPWHLLFRAARVSPGICHFSFLSNFHE